MSSDNFCRVFRDIAYHAPYLTLRIGSSRSGFSVLRGSLRHLSLKGLPGPLYVSRRIVVSMEAGVAVRARMPTDRKRLPDYNATARTRLTGVGRRHGYHS